MASIRYLRWRLAIFPFGWFGFVYRIWGHARLFIFLESNLLTCIVIFHEDMIWFRLWIILFLHMFFFVNSTLICEFGKLFMKGSVTRNQCYTRDIFTLVVFAIILLHKFDFSRCMLFSVWTLDMLRISYLPHIKKDYDSFWRRWSIK